jgi:hypothetical protein
MLKLGVRVRDIIGGFEGIATKRCEVLHGSTTFLAEGRDNGFRRDELLEEARLRAVDEKTAVAVVSTLVQPTTPTPPQ